ncbi:M42 family metallopeptidase [Anaerolineales bacterium HSG6]|nr:M42 family metallopeptidase [Anaerolineales bacterium HSG6]
MYLEKLSNAFGVSGSEENVRDMIVEIAKPYADEWQVDTMGNLFITRQARRGSKTPAQRVMVTAHMDEVGFLISKINNDGLLKFETIGGFDKRVLLGKSLVIGKNRIPGVIGLKPIHLLDHTERQSVPSIKSMYIDVGANSKGGTKVNIGDSATFSTQFGYLGGTPVEADSPPPKQGRVKGKAFDDRVGCAILLELLKDEYDFDLIAVFTVQEEIGVRGAKVAAYRANPDLAIILECTAADDLPRPNEEDEVGIPRLGDGPAITIMDRTFIANRSLVDLLTETAINEGIPYQFKRPGIGGTDAKEIHIARSGVPSAVVSVPARYIHAPAAVLDLADFWHAVELVQATLEHLPIEI